MMKMKQPVFLIAVFALATIAHAAPPANTIHPGILDNKGTGINANPNDDVGGKHGIGNVPGQSGDNPNDDGVNGFRNELDTVHGGILDVTDKSSDKPSKGGGKEKVTFCHYEEILVIDAETGLPALDENGEQIVDEERSGLQIRSMSIKGFENGHCGDINDAGECTKHVQDTAELITFALDSDGDGAYNPDIVRSQCSVPLDAGFILIGSDSVIDPDDTDPDVPVLQ